MFLFTFQRRSDRVRQRAQPVRGGDQADVDGQLDRRLELRSPIQRSQVQFPSESFILWSRR